MIKPLCWAFACAMVWCAVTANASEHLKIAVISRGTNARFFRHFTEGVEHAADELSAADISIELMPLEPQHAGNRTEQQQLIQRALDGHVNGILLDPVNRKDPIAAVEAAARQVPVVLFDSSLDSSAPVSRVEIDNRGAGRMAARYLAQRLRGKGNVLLLRYFIHSGNAEDREEGFLEVIENEFPDIHIVASDFHAGATRQVAKRVSTTLLHMHGAELNGVFASSESATEGMIDALHEAGIPVGKIKLVGVDEAGDDLTELVKARELDGFIWEDAIAMGGSSLRAIVSAARGEKPDRVIHSEITLRNDTGAVVTPPITAAPAISKAQSTAASVTTPSANPTATAPSVSAPVDFTIPDLNLAMVAIRPGSFRMGPPEEGDNRGDETPHTKVTLTAFWIGKFEVTQAQWQNVMGTNPSDFKDDNRPVENINWNDAMEFCRRLSDRERSAGRLPGGYAYTLPTEAQWEYACRAGTAGAYYAKPETIGWFATDSGAVDPASGIWRLSTHPVGQKAPNAWGVYDMCGNVAEWCRDFYGPYPGGAVTDPMGPASGTYHVLRGGCWWADVQNCRSDSRHKAPPTRWHSATGMRLALSVVTDR